jgi:hypothetical protein
MEDCMIEEPVDLWEEHLAFWDDDDDYLFDELTQDDLSLFAADPEGCRA